MTSSHRPSTRIFGTALAAVARVLAEASREGDPTWRADGREGTIPTARGLPVIGNALDLSGDLVGFLAAKHPELGPVFRLRVLGRDLHVLAGTEANALVARHGGLFLSSHFVWSEYCKALGTTRTVVGMDGPEHVRMRRALAYGYSRVAYERQMERMVEVLGTEIGSWRVGAVLPGYPTMQRLVIEQIGRICTGCSPEGYHEDLARFLDDIMMTTVIGTRPMLLYARRLRRSAKRIEGLCRRVIATHLKRDGPETERSLLGDVIDLHRRDPALVPECDLKALALSPFLAGLDTVAATCAFALHALLRRPELLARVRAEADTLIGQGPVTAGALREAETLRRVGLETLRLYPVAPAIVRHVATSFSFAGYRIPAGERALVATAVPHRMAEHFEQPERFDIDRHLPERAEGRARYAFAPFGVGTHRCLGRGLAVPQIALTLAAIVHHAEIELDPPGWAMKTRSTPTLRPGRGFRLRVLGLRGGAGAREQDAGRATASTRQRR